MKKLLTLLLSLISIGLLAQTFGQNKVNSTKQDWSVLKTTHFDIYFPAGEDIFGKTAALMAEEIYYYLKADLKYPVISRIPIVFYSTKSEFQATNIIYPLLSEGVGGFTESLRNRVVVPFDGSYSALEELLTHELTHAYINALDKRVVNAVESLRPVSFPFWFSEGLPEFLSIGGEDDYNNMFILDMVVNDNLPKLEFIDGYLAYRLGESFITFIANTYGREKVSEYFYSLRTMTSLEEATKRVFGMKFKELESRWRYQLKRDYFPTVNKHKIPQEAFERRTDSKEDGSYFNFSPRFSPDGSRYVYFSNAGARYSIWLANTQGEGKAKKIHTGESTAKTEEFYFFRSNLSWFPDNERIAFSAKTASGDRIHIMNVENGRFENTIRIPEMNAIFEVDVAPDGKSIVFSGQKGMQTDLFIYDLEQKTLQQLTNDYYFDYQPKFSPDGNRVVFTSERYEAPESKRQGFFANFTTDIFEYQLVDNSILQITNEPFNCSQPFYTDQGKKILFLSARDRITNLEVIDLEKQQIAKVTDILAGTYNGDITDDTNYLILSNHFDGAWNIYFGNTPLADLKYSSYPAPTVYSAEGDLLDLIDFNNLDFYGPRKRGPMPKGRPQRQQDARRPVFSGFEPTVPDSELIAIDYSWDAKPDSVSETPPTIKKYRPRFALDTLWGGAAYSASGGAVGSIELGLSDLMGDHAIGISAGIAERLIENNLLVTYLYLKPRLDWGLGAYNFYDEAYYRDYKPTGSDYYRLRERQTGFYGMMRYPFSRFSRIEFDGMLYEYERHWDYLNNNNINTGTWQDDIWPAVVSQAFAPGISLVHDNALYGSAGPMVGWRGIYTIRKSFAKDKLDYLTNYIDIRSYTLFSKRYSIALRANGAISTGNSPDRFSLGGYYGVRALEYNLSGYKKVLASAELRFPMLDYLALAFPIPITFGNIRGSAFVDAGAVWDENKYFRGAKDGLLEDVKLGYGFGPRLNLGYFVLKLDVAWQTNLSKISKPQVYFSLSEDF